MRLKNVLLALVFGLAIVVAACAPAATPTPTAPTTATLTPTAPTTATAAPAIPTPTASPVLTAIASPTPTGTPLVPTGSENFRFLISDEENAIEEFERLDVTIDRIGVLKGGESGRWVNLDPETREVDLTKLQGTNAQTIWSGTLAEGHYSKVFVFISEVTGVLLTGESVDVKLPSQKLQIRQPFDIAPGSLVSFVYDLTVVAAGNERSGIKYILKPQAGKSGAGLPYTEVQPAGEQPPKPRLDLVIEGDVTPGETITVTVTLAGEAVQGATVTVNGVEMGTTNEEGVLSLVVPDAEKWEIEAQATLDGDEIEGEMEIEPFVEAEGVLELSLSPDDIQAGEEATLLVLFEGLPLKDAVVSLNGEVIDTTNEDGEVTFVVPTGVKELEIEAQATLDGDDVEGEMEVELFVEATTPEAPEPTETPEAPEPTETPETPEPTETPETPEPTETPETPEPTETPETLEPTATPA